MQWTKALVLGAGILMAAEAAQAKQVFCVFDLVGKNGDVYTLMKDYQLAAKNWGADIELRVGQNEAVIAEDFKAGKCDGISVTGMRGRQFNKFTGSLDAIGAIPDLKLAVKVMQGLASPTFAKYMTNSKYEVAGVIPVGDAFLMVNDRSINTVAKAAGKKIAVLDYDEAQKIMVQQIGAQAVSADVTNFGSKFNNRQVDIIGAPAAVFKPLELHKGLGTKGAIVNYPILQVTGNLIIRPDKFPAGYGQKSREWVKTQLPRAFGILGKMKADIPQKYWMNIPAADKPGYQKLMRESRIDLTRRGIYDKRMMKLLWQFRCKEDRSNFECSLQDENYK
ncbi:MULTISPECIES: putative solute-binding protein [Acinetobacter]|uniref:putative solute-binding protein n=1 Tax=Acinetobacter TaxID=469 RepID=UPI0004537A2B|nr:MULTISPECIES: putative solute-binding protein [Acinetobacter]EXB72391.1 putative rND type efflux pump [Acinetobacter sp. 230853]EXC34283.1 putative rND type efflux pump [Acinetobacter sp. 869535]